MPPTVMVPLDGSPAAEVALPWAALVARRTGGTVRLVGVHAPPAVLLDGETLVGSIVPDESIRARETGYFAEVQARLQAIGVAVSTDLLDGGVVSSLADYARREKPTWIVMLTHGRGAIARFLLGETATEFVRESPCPVLLVHPADGPIDLAVRPIMEHILVPLDSSELAERMIEPVTGLAKAVGADVTLMMALAAVPDMAPAKAERYLEHHADRLRAQSIQATSNVIAAGGAADAIVAKSAAPGTIVALATHGRGGLSKLVWGSVTQEVVRRATAPVLVFKPSAT
jgi:nucleotide-binding universal stress UspA family protein